MRSYELMLVFRPDFDTTNEKKCQEAIKKLTGDGITLKEVKVIGKKQLAYPIVKHHEGVYVLAQLESEPGLHVANIERQMRLGEDVIRYLLTAI